MTWVQIKDGLRSAFQGVAWVEQMEFKLRLRMQRELETVEAYVQYVINLCHKVDENMKKISKINLLEAEINGLKPTLLEKVMLMENNTLERPLENIRKVETARYMAGQRVDNLLAETSERTERQYERTSVYEQY